MRHLLLLSAIVAIALSQYCPMCAAGACTFAAPGMASCSACEAGALLNVTSNADSVENGVLDHKTIGMCQACPIGCYSCHFALVSPSMSTPIYANQCDNCADGYVYNYANGGCELLPSNCLSGSCVGNNCYAVSCTECRAGYTVVRNDDTWSCYQTGTMALEDQEETSGSGVGATIWIVVTTLALAVMVGLYVRERRKNVAPLILNPAAQKRVSF